MPVVYAYATTMRKAQGSTLDLVGLLFDRRRADRGYAYVGASRAKRMADVYLLGRIRRSDWLPVGGDPRGNEQEYPGSLSGSDSEETPSTDSEEAAEDTDDEEEDGADPTAWNPFRPRQWEEPQSEEELEEGEPDTPPSSQEPSPSVEDFQAPSTDREEDDEDSRPPADESDFSFEWAGLFD